MELVRSIFYRKINPSDFKKMYDIDKPVTGGGQTYIEAAGILESDLYKFLENAKIEPSPLSGESRTIYKIETFVLGKTTSAEIEFAPRKGRNYRISRQNQKHKHPAWRESNNFPVPNKLPNGQYTSNFAGIIDDLIIYIIHTNKEKYYAGFLNDHNIPNEWPSGVGLEKMLTGERRGVAFFEQPILFSNNLRIPFSLLSGVSEQLIITDIPDNFGDTSSDAVEFVTNDIILEIDYDNLKTHKCEPSGSSIVTNTNNKNRNPKKRDYNAIQRNKTKIGNVGEEIVLHIEKSRLFGLGVDDSYIKQIKWVSQDLGDGLGYDIESFDFIDGILEKIFIEVKTTTSGINKPFDVTANEVDVSSEKGCLYYIYRVFELRNNATEVKYYTVSGSIKDNFNLVPTSFAAYYHGDNNI